jgi:hypothetical protein
MKKTFSPSGEMAIKSVSVLEKLALGNQKGASSIHALEKKSFSFPSLVG